ncbi:MAG: hypothetical protein ABR949_15550 [Candidatus Aquilonibacter sp.]
MRLFVAVSLIALAVSCAPPSRGFTPALTPSPSPTTAPSATPTALLTPTASPTPTHSLTPSPSPTPTPTASPTPTPAPTPTPMLSVNPTSLTFTTLGTQQTFQVNEAGYTGTFTLNDGGSCAGVALYAPSSGPGPSLTVTITSISNGSCTITATDSNGQTAPETITVSFI